MFLWQILTSSNYRKLTIRRAIESLVHTNSHDRSSYLVAKQYYYSLNSWLAFSDDIKNLQGRWEEKSHNSKHYELHKNTRRAASLQFSSLKLMCNLIMIIDILR